MDFQQTKISPTALKKQTNQKTELNVMVASRPRWQLKDKDLFNIQRFPVRGTAARSPSPRPRRARRRGPGLCADRGVAGAGRAAAGGASWRAGTPTGTRPRAPASPSPPRGRRPERQRTVGADRASGRSGLCGAGRQRPVRETPGPIRAEPRRRVANL